MDRLKSIEEATTMPLPGTAPRLRVAGVLTSALMTLLVAVTAVLAVGAGPAAAEISDNPQNYWGVVGLDLTTTNNVKSHVWAIEQVGNTIYVGGKYQKVLGDGTRYNQPYLAAFHADTGRWIDWWRPVIDGPVYALEASPDGSKLFVGGEFKNINGRQVDALAALEPATGNLVPGWSTRVSGGAPAVVHNFDTDGPWLYVVGAFKTVARNGRRQGANSAVRVRHDNGIIDRRWKPRVEGGTVFGVAASPSTARVYLAGFFTSVNNAPDTSWAAVLNSGNGAPIPGLRHVPNSTDPLHRSTPGRW